MSRIPLAITGLALFPESMIDAAVAAVDKAVAAHKVTKVFGLFSGGHDSVCAVDVASQHSAFAGIAHLNTGTGIPETRDYVAALCLKRGWPFHELTPDKETYRSLVLKHGFPAGPRSHHRMYYWLKQRQIRRLVREHKTHRLDRVALVTGVRLQESQRRMTAALSVEVRREGAQLWINPILSWTKDDCNAYMAHRKLERNLVVDLLHRSGECLCGALAQPGELKEIEYWYPHAVRPIRELEAECATKGMRDCKWATRPPKKKAEALTEQWADLPMCVGCMKGYAA